jgi:hypothetical protein
MSQRIGRYYLYLGKDCDYNFVNNNNGEFHLLGSIYDWETPKFTNKQILQEISQVQNIEYLLKMSDKYCGIFILIVKFHDQIFIFNDATAQKEVYYDSEFTCFGSQPKLLGQSVRLLEHNDKDATYYYKSPIFKKKKLFVNESTHKRNVFHLMPNYILNVTMKSRHRFFPSAVLKEKPLEYVAEKSSKILKGYITAIAKRNKIKMAVTGGYDSRVLFLASLDVECEYYVSKHPYMDVSHHDIVISKRLTHYYGKKILIENDKINNESIKDENYINDIDFPRFLNINKSNNKFVYINGNISEIARNYFGYLKNATAEDLCFLSGNLRLNFAIEQYRAWLKNKPIFKKYGYNYLDMFYWEEKMGNWAAKSKTETIALGLDVISPFNSRQLLSLLLSTNRKYRDSHFNHLYNMIIYKLSRKDEKIMKIPINPSIKQSIIRLMKYFKIYNMYRYIGIKTRVLKP